MILYFFFFFIILIFFSILNLYWRHCILFALDLHARPRKFQKYYLLCMGSREHLDWCGATRSGIGAPEVPFSGQIDKNALGQPWVDKSQNWVKVIQKQYLSCFYIKPELLSDFRQLWLSLTWGWLLKGIEILILIQPSKRFGTSAIAKIIKFPFQQLFMG